MPTFFSEMTGLVEMLVFLVQIHVDAYMLTLERITVSQTKTPPLLDGFLPVNTLARISPSDTLAFEPVLLEDGGIPGPSRGRAEEHPPTDL